MVIGYISYQQGDWRRLVYGFDDYGNICGVKNDPVEGAPLSGRDMTNKTLVVLPFNHCKKALSRHLTVCKCLNNLGKALDKTYWY